ncbi:hypothetical protein JMJ77_0014543 [Colletotrichum scovillei]|uniref:Uncharacterized protein n=1 Tax=Colletotrichum scovillei TaxID=1209932 RepID=A0A9P7R6Y7_9PEZI|nr:hypothetical protein JMJ77_0014543 [Colletotrichum scovillei]KAG7066080.1 hypothetical protein JMJ78_0012817 [Colletotrichum scovillei]KAG7068680.1 hypothetical protein JMJ76_0008360 [Colletotrichum scovillei]
MSSPGSRSGHSPPIGAQPPGSRAYIEWTTSPTPSSTGTFTTGSQALQAPNRALLGQLHDR